MKKDGLEYKMVVTDMDYTLLNKEKKVSDRNREALKRAADKGVHLVVATGRIYTSARLYARLLGMSSPIIASNGAIIREASINNKENTERTIFKDALNEKVIREMIRLSHKYGLYCHFFTENTIYSEKLVNVSLRYTEWNKYMGEEDQVRIKIVDDAEKILEDAKSEVLKAVVSDEDEEKIQRLRDSIMETGIVSVSQSMKHNLEVMNKGVTKGNAVRILAQMYGINREEIIAIGDNENDISMIEYAGLGIAMGNAEESLKRVADHITGDYQEDGVAEAIEQFIL
ncbi:MAG: HAD family phosphatase [Gracilibacteraceae bacterium]|jgi:Cof subfamily protein (haloacid dehalogenase superfamily)|nr:HAD family phosphatase [Gracilibacteraceae bacterium]